MKVGELARRAGVTVRTLHHYEAEGLLAPGTRTPAGHRLYTEDHLDRLRQIQALRELGLTLAEVRLSLTEPQEYLQSRIRSVRRRLEEQLAEQRQRLHRLEQLEGQTVTSVDDLTQRLKEVIMFERYFSPEQLEQLRERREGLGEAGMQQSHQEWAQLLAELRAHHQAGLDPTAAPVQALARQARALIEAFTGGDPAVSASLQQMYAEQDPAVVSRGQMDRDLMDFLHRAQAALPE